VKDLSTLVLINYFFSIGQKGNKSLLEAIKNHLHKLAPEGLKDDIVHVNSGPGNV
jgi:hypothetical protein